MSGNSLSPGVSPLRLHSLRLRSLGLFGSLKGFVNGVVQSLIPALIFMQTALILHGGFLGTLTQTERKLHCISLSVLVVTFTLSRRSRTYLLLLPLALILVVLDLFITQRILSR